MTGSFGITSDGYEMEADVSFQFRCSIFIFKAEQCCFFDVCESLFNSLALAVTPLEREV